MKSSGIVETMVSPSAASYFSCDGTLLTVFENSKMAHYGFVFPTKSFSLLPRCKIRYFNFYINLSVRLEILTSIFQSSASV